ncbi:hypothetical protein PSPO_b0986 [Pseudoalteromonas spongiae UST010723-006]|nr:hypothetical protein PSPO_b0986 [Pseudoalteromonas spongiae UST010723-006]
MGVSLIAPNKQGAVKLEPIVKLDYLNKNTVIFESLSKNIS